MGSEESARKRKEKKQKFLIPVEFSHISSKGRQSFPPASQTAFFPLWELQLVAAKKREGEKVVVVLILPPAFHFLADPDGSILSSSPLFAATRAEYLIETWEEDGGGNSFPRRV